MAAVLMDRAGRRPLLLTSFGGMAACAERGCFCSTGGCFCSRVAVSVAGWAAPHACHGQAGNALPDRCPSADTPPPSPLPAAAPKALEGSFSLAAILAYIIFFALGAG